MNILKYFLLFIMFMLCKYEINQFLKYLKSELTFPDVGGNSNKKNKD